MRHRSPSLRTALGLALAAGFFAASAQAAPVDQARRIYDRLAGVPPSEALLVDLTDVLQNGDPVNYPGLPGPEAVAFRAMQHPAFVNVVLKNWVKPWSNEDRTVFVPLNDYVATVIGLIRDDRDFREVLSADVVYVGDRTEPELSGVRPFSQTSNLHYEDLEQRGVDLSDPELLERETQSEQVDSLLGPDDAAGVVTSRAAAESFFVAGTNRAMWRFTAINYLCRDMEQLKDVTRPADRIRQDVSRSPGGDSELFHDQCVGCHSGMDPLSGAYAYYDWDSETGDGRLIYTPTIGPRPKYFNNQNTFAGGYITTNDRWDNFWRFGVNAELGWRESLPGGGFGLQSMGEEIANSRAFAICQTEKVFREVCFRPPESAEDAAAVQSIATDFEGSGYSMKTVFAKTAVYCMGE